LIAYAKANPGKLSYGRSVGSIQHLTGELFKPIAGTPDIVGTLSGTGPLIANLLGGQIQWVPGVAAKPNTTGPASCGFCRRGQRGSSPFLPTAAELGSPA
jgi:tripartite-type tricarboxylate transporter receptor subunit TctC